MTVSQAMKDKVTKMLAEIGELVLDDFYLKQKLESAILMNTERDGIHPCILYTKEDNANAFAKGYKTRRPVYLACGSDKKKEAKVEMEADARAVASMRVAPTNHCMEGTPAFESLGIPVRIVEDPSRKIIPTFLARPKRKTSPTLLLCSLGEYNYYRQQ